MNRYIARDGSYWDVSAPRDIEQFLRQIVNLLPDGAILYVEGCNTPSWVKSSLKAIETKATIRLPRGTFWPSPDIFHIPITQERMAACVSAFAGKVPTHIQAYHGDVILLQWFDAEAGDPIMVSGKIPEDKIAEFCRLLGCTFTSDVPMREKPALIVSQLLFGVAAIQAVAGILAMSIYSPLFTPLDWIVSLSFLLFVGLGILAIQARKVAALIAAAVYAGFLALQTCANPKLQFAVIIFKIPIVVLLIASIVVAFSRPKAEKAQTGS